MTKLGKIILLGAFGVACSLASPKMGMAEGSIGDYTVPDGPVELYGQTLNPSKVEVDGKMYPWGKLKNLVPELLPDARKLSMPAAEFCDHIVMLSELYAIEADKAEDFLVNKLADAYPDESPFKDEPIAFAVSDRLSSSSSKKLDELMKLMPGYEERILVVRDAVRKHQTMTYLHDAAIVTCPAHAEKNGYSTILSYDGPDKDYDSDKDPMWEEFEKKVKSEK